MKQRKFKLQLRIPSWNPTAMIHMYEPVSDQMVENANEHFSHTVSSAGLRESVEYQKQGASSYDPRVSWFMFLHRTWSPGDILQFNIDMSIQLRRAHPKVQGHAGKVTITRGPLVYCLESVDNPDIDIFIAQLDPSSLRHEFNPGLLGGCVVIHGKTTDGGPLKFIPYFLWANRGGSQMMVWVNCK